MGFRSFTTLTASSLVITGLLLSMLTIGMAEVRTSTNYQLESDSINFTGGLSTSSNYTLESTAGEIATGPSDSSTYRLRAGYQQMQEVFISMTAPSAVVMTPDLGGLTGGESNGTTSVSVLTDSPSGYELTIEAESAPAMRKGADTIADYVPAGAPDFNFNTGATQAHFGFSPSGSDIVQRFRDSVGVCNSGSGDEYLKCWDGLATTPISIARGSGGNQPGGATTTIHFKVGIGGNTTVIAGDYYATTTLTALPL